MDIKKKNNIFRFAKNLFQSTGGPIIAYHCFRPTILHLIYHLVYQLEPSCFLKGLILESKIAPRVTSGFSIARSEHLHKLQGLRYSHWQSCEGDSHGFIL